MKRLHLLPALAAFLALVVPAHAQPGSPETVFPAARLVVYCFHGQIRCATCEKMEEYTRHALEEHFADGLRSGRVVFRLINLSRPENAHFLTDYQLTSWSVVLSLQEGGKELRYRYLEEIKDYVKDQQFFTDYLFKEIESFLTADRPADR